MMELEKAMKPEAGTLVGIHCKTVFTYVIRQWFWCVFFFSFAMTLPLLVCRG